VTKVCIIHNIINYSDENPKDDVHPKALVLGFSTNVLSSSSSEDFSSCLSVSVITLSTIVFLNQRFLNFMGFLLIIT
jgi:hypothetical protein